MPSPVDILQNETFVSWIDNSVTIGSDGIPTVFCHRSRSTERFEEFLDTMNKNQYNNCKGFYFVNEHHKEALSYLADGIEYYVFLKILKPLYIYPKGFYCECSRGIKHEPLDINEAFITRAKNDGFDGIIIKNSLTLFGVDEFVVFESSQIKSTDNEVFSMDNNIFK